MTAISDTLLFRRKASDVEPVTDESMCLFRLGEGCNNRCRMCPRPGQMPDFLPFEELTRRLEFLRSEGFRRVMLTGGEPTIHPSFHLLVDAVRSRGMAWCLNTNGRSFSDRAFAARAAREGLQRTIVSFHTHRADVHKAMSDAGEAAHAECMDGVRNALAEGLDMLLNCVVSTANLDTLEEYALYCADNFGTRCGIKLVYPIWSGRAADWPPLHYRYSEARPALDAVQRAAAGRGLSLAFEAFPNCILGRPDIRNVGRLGFGETHYLHDLTGDRYISMRWLESRQHRFAECCRVCKALSNCSGVSVDYADRFGVGELQPFA